MIKATVRYNSKLSDPERALALPLLGIAQTLIMQMSERIRRGVSSTGTFAPLAAYSSATAARGLFWVPPGQSQPAGWISKTDDGWAGYLDYPTYAGLRGGGPRTFHETDALFSTIGARVNGPGRVKITFRGTHPRPSSGHQWHHPTAKAVKAGGGRALPNTTVAFLASRREPAPMLTPTPAEIEGVVETLRGEIVARLSEAGEAQRARSRRDGRSRQRQPAVNFGR